jgi:hypothetical protein
MASNAKRTKRIVPRRRARVFIFGAGVSASCGIPVSKDLLRESISALGREDSAKARQVHNLLTQLYPGFDEGYRTYPNIEDFLNLLETAKAVPSKGFIGSTPWSEDDLRSAKKITLKAVTDYLWTAVQKKNKLQCLRQFAERELKINDVLITFNWDVTFERVWEEDMNGEIDYQYSKGGSSASIFLLKPHGSIDWFKNSDLPRDRKGTDLTELDEKISAFPYFDFRHHPGLFKKQPIIVPPVTAKEFNYPYLKETWQSVYKAVANATELQIIGYSLPEEDQYARLMLRLALRANNLAVEKKRKLPLKVLVVNPDRSVMFSLSRLLESSPREVRFLQAYFHDYVAGLS